MSKIEFKSTEKTIEMPCGTIASYIEYNVLKDGESIGNDYMFDDDLSDDQIDMIDSEIGNLRNQTPKRVVISAEFPAEEIKMEIQKQKLWGVVA